MSVFDSFRSQNSIEHAPEPELAPALPTPLPGGTAPGSGSALPGTMPGGKADPAGIQAHYYIENVGKERRYFKDLDGKQLAFRADNKAVTTKQEDQATISHMLDVAQSRGWTSLHVRGSATFKQEAWIEAQARGLSVKGYEPSADDRRSLDTRRKTRQQQAKAAPAGEPENVIANTSPALAPEQAIGPAPATTPTASAAAPGTAQEVAAAAIQSKTQAAATQPAETPPKVPVQAGTQTVGQGSPASETLPPAAALVVAEAKFIAQVVKITRDPKADLDQIRNAFDHLDAADTIRLSDRVADTLQHRAKRTGDSDTYDRVLPYLPGQGPEERRKLEAEASKAKRGAGDADNLENQRLDRNASGKARPAEPGADAGELVERTGKAERAAPAAKAGPEPINQQYPSRAREPWLEELGGYAALSPTQQASAERSHERWVTAGTPQKPHTMDIEEYVDHVQGKQAEARAKQEKLDIKAHDGKGAGETKAEPTPSASAAKATAENGAAEATQQLSPDARKLLAYVEARIETKMGKLTDEVKADLRTHAAQAIVKRENDVGLMKLPAVKTDRKQQTKRNQVAEAPKRKASAGEQKAAQIEQPRMRVGG